MSHAVHCVVLVSDHRDTLSGAAVQNAATQKLTIGSCTTGGPTEVEWEMVVASEFGVN